MSVRKSVLGDGVGGIKVSRQAVDMASLAGSYQLSHRKLAKGIFYLVPF